MAPLRRSFVRIASALPAALAILSVTSPPPARSQEPAPSEFRLLGDLPGGLDYSVARGVSADGTVVVGDSYSENGLEAFRWTTAGGMEGLGDLPGGNFSSGAYAISGDGLTIVGSSQSAASQPLGAEGFAWTAAGGMVPLGDLPGNLYASVARASSHDGRVLAGTSASFANLFDACYWSDLVGPTSIGGLGGGFNQSDANGVSGDGTRIVGRHTPPGANVAFSWTSAGGMVSLPDLDGGDVNCNALAISADGLVAVGHGTDSAGQYAVRWVGDSIESLGDLPGGLVSGRAYACSADGSVVVGTGMTAQGPDAFIWNAQRGMRSLRSVLDALGVSGMDAFVATEASGISADGTVIVGHGYDGSGDSRAWRAVLGDEPPPPLDRPLLPTKVSVKVKTAKPDRSKLVLEGYLDLGPDTVDLAAPCDVHCAGLLLNVPSFTRLRSGTWRHTAAGLKIDLVPASTGSSLVKLKVKRKGELLELVPTNGLLDVRASREVRHAGTVRVEKGKYGLGGKGELEDPGLFLTSSTLRLRQPGAQRLSLEASLVGGAVPSNLPDSPDVLLEFGDELKVVVPGTAFVAKRGRLEFSGDISGITKVVLDPANERMTVTGRGLSLGTFPDGEHTVTVRLGLGPDIRTATVRMVSKRKKLRY